VIAVDTSILVRYFVQDDPELSARATYLLEEQLTPNAPGLVSVVALQEMFWVLRRFYNQSVEQLCVILIELCNAPNLIVQHREEVLVALGTPADFSDALIHHIGSALGAAKTMTFDKKFARLDGVELLAD
jgi:predicted nucleic-acid-binding protein